MKTPVSFFLLLWFCLPPPTVFSSPREVREVHYQMGSFLEITLWHAEPERGRRLLRDAVREVHRLDGILSNFDPASSVSRLNQYAGIGKIAIPTELHELLGSARRFSQSTGGYFDVTVGPLVELWREALLAGRVPASDALASVLRLVGYEKLKIYGNQEAELLLPGMKIDLGGIGKGYAVDRIAAQLRAAGINSAMINFGGSSIYAIGTPPGKDGWEVGIKEPNETLRGIIYLRDRALSTSGSMGKSWSVGGKRYGHLIDPKTGVPVTEPRLATVVAETATAADALTKALVLRGNEALPAVWRADGAAVAVISTQDSRFFSPGFKSKTRWQEVRGP